MACALCGEIPSVVVARTGRDEYFEAPVTALRPLDIGGSQDFRECPACGALFHFEDDTAFTGSGINDEQTLTRLSANDSAAVRAFVRRGGAMPVADGLFALPYFELVLDCVMERDRELASVLLPAVLAEAVRRGDRSLLSRIEVFVRGRPADAMRVLNVAAGAGSAVLEPLISTCRREVCRTCPEGVRALGGGLWECPECEATFDGEVGSMMRHSVAMSRAVHACLRGDLSGAEMVLSSERPLRAVLRCRPGLIGPLRPRLVREMPRWPWLRAVVGE